MFSRRAFLALLLMTSCHTYEAKEEVLHRITREIWCPKITFSTCCDEVKPFTDFFALLRQNHTKQCEGNESGSRSQIGNPMECIMLCNFQRTRMANAAGFVDPEKVKVFLRKNYGNKEQRELLLKRAVQCARFANPTSEEFQVENPEDCNNASLLYIGCLISYVNMICPEEEMQKDEVCTKVRKHMMEKCKHTL
ncbi:uncharacterized protein [Periplaneta americana]|uniref:uncharacterized protein n=1 Tax=Periplaneta americana TaxID=6978 RepID=UPI0037E7D4C7